MSGPIRVFLVDDHAVVRQGVRTFLELQPDLEVVGEAADGAGAVQRAAAARPDVVLMDLVMPGGGGPEAIRNVRAALPKARILVLSSYVDDAQVFAALHAGASGYLLKDIQPEALADAVRQTHQGLQVLHPQVAAHLLRGEADLLSLADFTPRERDVLKLLAEGFANKEIARRLFISEKTVKTHVSNILQKLGVSDRTQAALMAVRRGLVQ
jgi:DNA-binding NarL/FixJ family response regulator